ncbi:MAG: S8 family peptidase [Alphaproteobacteria bacterium]
MFFSRYILRLMLAFYCLCFISLPSFAEENTPDFVPGELIIGFKSEKARQDALQELQTKEESGGFTTRGGGSKSITAKPIGNKEIKLKLNILTTRGIKPQKQEELTILKEMSEDIRKSDSTVEYAHPNWIFKSYRSVIREPVLLKNQLGPANATQRNLTSGPNDPIFQRGLHWDYLAPPKGMNAIGAWSISKGGKQIVVAVLDTGMLFKHPDIEKSGNVLEGYDFISNETTAGDGDGRDADATDAGNACSPYPSSWHGTHVAATIGGAATNNGLGIAGVNWEVSVVPVRVLGRCGGSIADISDAIRWAAGLTVADVPDNKNPADIINMSLGGVLDCRPENVGNLINAINDARQAGVTVVVAAGNDALDVKKVTPGGCAGVISVAASDQRGYLAPYSNFGAVTIMAPGGNLKRDDDKDGEADGIWSLVAPTEKNPMGVAAYEGTSMAAPHVSAAIALAISHDEKLRKNPNVIEEMMVKAAVKPVAGACPEQKNCGKGSLDAVKLLSR